MFYPISGYFTANGAIASDARTGEYGYRSSIGSCNLRYDADINTPDLAYTQKTITTMYNHCTRGVVVELASKYTSVEDDLINYDPGKMLNWAKEEF